MPNTIPTQSQSVLLQQIETHTENPPCMEMAPQEFPYGTTLKLEFIETGAIG